ncbi:TraB/GumN family protein [Shewanella subflava]|uniref:TraB/GumN family protein n=1 Tax=Shewanella subflava TaxID=2986476 RepID=A0ABT3I5H8_9GAMM|nr:TraB/GumN family protein [Shewanella subflava]MCW3171334.1 TraB/GumN family protein [Shewanella subflava]
MHWFSCDVLKLPLRGKCALWLIFAILSLPFSASAAPEDKPPFYKVTWHGQDAFLLGSIHVGKADFYPMAKPIEAAFAKSTTLVIEADIEKADTASLLAQYGTASEELLQKAQHTTARYCQQMQPLCNAIKPFAPWLQAAQISMVRFANLGYSADLGVDARFASNRQSKTLLELESVAFQFELISSFKEKTQLQMLDEAVNATDDEMRALIQAWRTGDEVGLAAMMEQQAGGEDELLSQLLWQRNHTMSDKMLLMMQQQSDQQLFFIIGAGHLVGQQNIPDLLRQQGATVQACWQQSCI